MRCHTIEKMKTILKMAVLAFMVIGMSSRCYALRLIHGVSTEQAAQELGVKITSEVVATNQIGVRLEFSPHGKLERFSHGELEVVSGGRELVCATLLPLQQTNDKVVLYFSADQDYVQKSTLSLIVSVDQVFAEGYSFAMKDFVKMPLDTVSEPTASRHLTEAQVLAIAKPLLPLPAGESYQVNFRDGTWEVFTEPDGVQVRGGRVILVQDSDGKTQAVTRY
jgi:hypothetical protein